VIDNKDQQPVSGTFLSLTISLLPCMRKLCFLLIQQNSFQWDMQSAGALPVGLEHESMSSESCMDEPSDSDLGSEVPCEPAFDYPFFFLVWAAQYAGSITRAVVTSVEPYN